MRRVVGALAVATLSCQIILGLEEPTGTPVVESPPVEDAGEDPNDPCRHALRPKAPTQDDDLDTKKAYWFAAQSVTAPLSQAAGPLGFDLDNACTCQADLRNGAPSCVSTKTTCDLDRGIDDSLGAALAAAKQIPGAAGDAIKPVNENLQKGSRTLLFYLSDYNGKANDTDVRAGFVNSGGLYTNVGCDGNARGLEVTYVGGPGDNHTPPGKSRYKPAFDGCDHWSAEDRALGLGVRVPSVLTQGYVSNWQVVISLDQVTTALFGNPASIRHALFVAKITPEGTHFRADGIMAGRMPFADLIQAVGGNQAGDGYDDGGYPAACEQDYWNLLAVPRLCAARDIMAAQAEDFKGRDCDAASLNIGFSLVEARLADFDFTNPGQTKECPRVQCQ